MSGFVSGPRQGHILDADTVRLFRADEMSGTAALVDAVGGPAIPSVSGAKNPTPGQIDSMRFFTNTYGNFTNAGSPYANDFNVIHSSKKWTIEAWLYLDSTNWDSMMSGNPLDDYARVVATCSHGVGTASFFAGCLFHVEIKRATSDGRNARTVRALYEINVAGGGSPGSNLAVADSLDSLPLDELVHLGVAVDGVAGTCEFWINDRLGNVVSSLGAHTGGLTNAALTVGSHPQNNVHFFRGGIDDLRISGVRRSADEISESYNRGLGLYPSNDPQPEAYSLKRLLPPGKVWALGSNSSLSKWLAGAAEELHRVKLRGDAIVEESDPRTATETLDEWERELEITDIAGTTAARRLAITSKLIALGGQTAAYYVQIAAACGYTVTIDDSGGDDVLRAGRARAGDRVLPETNAFRWTVIVQAPTGTALTHAQLEAAISRAAPAHTIVSFTYL